jgi:syntaxin 8
LYFSVFKTRFRIRKLELQRIMGDSWLISYDACAQLGQDMMAEIHERNKLARTSSAHIKKTASIRGSMSRFERELSQLRDGLIQSSVKSRLTPRESDRRQTLIDQLVTRQKQLELAFNNHNSDYSTRTTLMSFSSSSLAGHDPWMNASGPTTSAGVDSDTDLLDVGQIRQHQQQMIAEQDRGLDALSRVIGRQKQIAIDIGNEVDTQNEIIDDITDHVDQTNVRLIRETKHVRVIDKKSNTCWMWIVIVLLVIAIVVIACVPYSK